MPPAAGGKRSWSPSPSPSRAASQPAPRLGCCPWAPELDGMLPVQDDSALDGFLDPELLEAVPVGASSVAEPVRAVLSSARGHRDARRERHPLGGGRRLHAGGRRAGRRRPDVRHPLDAAGRHRAGRVEPRPLRRRPAAGRRLRHQADPRHPARRAPQRGADPRHRRWRARRRHHLRPGRGADAVHPLDVEVGRRRRQRRRQARPQQHLRRRPGRRRLPVQRATPTCATSTPGRGRSGATTTPTSTSEWCSTWPTCTNRARSISCPRSAFRPASPRPGRGRRPPRR